MGLRPTQMDEKPLARAEIRHLQDSLQVTDSMYPAGGFSRERQRGICFFLGPAMLLRAHEKADPSASLRSASE
jgi:hypothetical protein